MTRKARLRYYWPEVLLVLAMALPWLSLLVFGAIWLWQSGHLWLWAAIAVSFGLLSWPLARFVRHRADAETRVALGDLAKPSRAWHVSERDAWADVTAIADATPPFSFIEIDPLVAKAQETVEAVARRFHPDAQKAWAQFSLPELMLLTERLSHDVRREALRHIPGIRSMRLSHLLWAREQEARYGKAARTSWQYGRSLWRVIRAALNPVNAAGQEAGNLFVDRALDVLSYRLRSYATRMLILEVGRAAIDLYSGRLALSSEEVRAAQESDAIGEIAPTPPVRIILAGQVNAGKSSLLNALAQETQSAIGPLPTTSRAKEFQIEVEGRPAVSIVDLPGLTAGSEQELLAQAQRADIVLWVVSATQPAREPDRQNLDAIRAWAGKQLVRRAPPILLALTHIDELRPASEWSPPYDIASPATPKARAIRDAIDAVARALAHPPDAIVPLALPPGRPPYNLDGLWARIALELDEAKLVQLDRLRFGRQALDLRELADQLGHAGRFMLKGIAG
jgi:predicted GTPase